ncbi:hypothetical protein [Paraburkholderia domus]|uniref:hypothetical protein n=1 Tax=Paraburkholderia domus TaxID=2793075 RepID=UPI0019135202|nr:hypothetical protein [Paraburkholderia domus]MBK5058905.1 hypothetical protein [Burkholderia sp. R-70199]CAE6880108.1 hypothetical protein R70199_02475 [Paraburkholderia domus]
MATKNVLVRILQSIRIHATEYLCNDVVSMPPKLAAVHEKAGTVDSDPDAVAYARDELGKEPIEHVVPDGAALVSDADLQSATGGAAAPVSTQGAADGQADAQAKIPGVDPAADPAAPAAKQ